METMRTLALFASLAPLAAGQEPIRVTDATVGCFHSDERAYAWRPTAEGYALGERTLSRDQLARIRRTVLACREQPADLLARVGITPESLAQHRAEIVETAMPRSGRLADGTPKSVPAELAHRLEWESVGSHLLALLAQPPTSSASVRFEVVLPGEPPITVSSDSWSPFMLPWTVAAGDERWTVADVAIPRALLPLADPDGPCAELLDGEEYWARRVWSDDVAWYRYLSVPLDRAFSAEAYVRLAGFERFAERLRVDDALTGNVNMQPLSLYVNASALRPSLVDRARWWSPIEEGEPSATWDDFLAAYDLATAAVARQTWLVDWKLAGPDRTIELQAVGARPRAETMLDTLVLPAWEHAELVDAPRIELLLRRGGEWCGTVWLAPAEPGALIETAHPASEPAHWLDALDFSFHPRATPPTYARVDGSGRHELRTIE